MDGNIEELVLSGKFFNPPSRFSSPIRTPSPSSPTRIAHWPNDADTEYDYDSDAERRRAIEQKVSNSHDQDSIGMGPGRTGVKGVIRDRNEANALQRSKKADDTRALNARMGRVNLGGKTWAEEEREWLAEKAREEGKTVDQLMAKGEVQAKGGVEGRRVRFGHLREVGVRGFVQAVEGEERHVWVVVHIYDASLDRCAILDDTLARLARLHPATKFLRARAGAIGFASSQPSTNRGSRALHVPKQPFEPNRTPSRKIPVPGRYQTEDDDEDEDYEYGSSGGEGDGEGWEDDRVDTDVLPTMLVYCSGELVHSWVRVDWEAKMGTEELLKRHHILPDTRTSARVGGSNGNCGFSSDDEDFNSGELVFGGSDDGY